MVSCAERCGESGTPTSTTQLAELLHWGDSISNRFNDPYASSLLITRKFYFLTSLKWTVLLAACLIATWKCKVFFQWMQLLDSTYSIVLHQATIIFQNCFCVQEQWIMKGRKWEREFPNCWPMARVYLCRRKKCLWVLDYFICSLPLKSLKDKVIQVNIKIKNTK